MTRLFSLVALVLLVSGWASSERIPDRDQVIRRIVPASVQLKSEREGGVQRSASGVVLASDQKSGRSWILTTQHFLEPAVRQEIYVSAPGGSGREKARTVAASRELDLAVVEVGGFRVEPVKFKEVAHLGEEVWVVAFPWGKRMTMVSGVVSQIAGDEGKAPIEGPAQMVDALVSYGSSGGGVFEAASGALVGIVEGYRTARVSIPNAPDRALEVPIPGETSVISSSVIRGFLASAGLGDLISKK